MLAALMCIASLGTAATLRVALDGSQPYTVIQTAINASAHGDTVLVYPGRYYENIRFNGKNITLSSLEMVTGDLQYEYTTIIDGSQNGSVIQIRNGESAVTVRGFTITNGSGFYDSNTDDTYGGGLLIGALSANNQIRVMNCSITGNIAGAGGGIQVDRCNIYLSGLSIVGNRSSIGGGIKASGSLPTQYMFSFDPVNRCSIYNNTAAFGCDMYFYLVNQVHVVVDTFTVAVPSNFYAAAIPADTSIQNPYTFDIRHSVHEEANHDLYVATWGDDANDGLSEGTPYKTVFKAVYDIASDPDNPKTIHVAEGYYSHSANQQFFPLPMKSYTRLVGESKSNVILDMEAHTFGIRICSYNCDVEVSNLTIQNCKGGIASSQSDNIRVSNVMIKNSYHIQTSSGYAGYQNRDQQLKNIQISSINSGAITAGVDIFLDNGSLSMEDIEISGLHSQETVWPLRVDAVGSSEAYFNGVVVHDNNSSDADMYNGIFQIAPFNNDCPHFKIVIYNSAFYNNHQSNPSYMAYAWAQNDTCIIRNCTFADNSGGNSALVVQGNVVMENNVFWNPLLQKEVVVYYDSSYGINSRVEFDNNCIRGGQNGIYNMSPLNQVIWKLNNFSSDPMFANGGNVPYRLSSQSPLIDRGVQAALGMPAYDAGGNERVWDGNGDGQAVIDIGAYEYQPLGNPVNLTAQVWQQQVLLSWQMSAPERSLSGYRVYRNGEVYADILEPASTWFRDYSSVNDTLSYYVVALYGAVETEPSNTITVVISGVGNADELAPGLYGKVTVSPNPFADLAVVSYELDKIARTELKIYNLKGQLVRTLYTGTQGKGEQHLAWEGCDDRGRPVAAGIYFLQLSMEGKALPAVKMVKW